MVCRMASSTQLRRGVVGPCILALLEIGPRYGLELVKELDAIGQLLSSQGTVYPLLNRLHEARFVTSYWEMSNAERPRRYYEITDAGRRELVAFREEWAIFSASVDSLFALSPAAKEKVIVGE
jgi:PadR family transcriptional regulator PadR